MHVINRICTFVYLYTGGVAIDITRDQKASAPDEVSRIAKAGGFVNNGRVMGVLAVARAFGDASLKTPEVSKAVTAEPEITSFRPLLEDEFIIIATDGLWDVMTSQDAVDFVCEALRSSGIDFDAMKRGIDISINEELVKRKLDGIADLMASHAYTPLGSQDNITVMILLINRCCSSSSGVIQSTSSRMGDVFTSVHNDDFGSKSEPSDSSSVDGERSRRGSRSIPPRPTAEVLRGHYADDDVSTSSVPVTGNANSGDELMDFLMDDNNF